MFIIERQGLLALPFLFEDYGLKGCMNLQKEKNNITGSKKHHGYNKKMVFQKITGTFRRQLCS
jgi:hypothetical protein